MWSLREEERAVRQQVLAAPTFTHEGIPSFWASVCTLHREGVVEVQWALLAGCALSWAGKHLGQSCACQAARAPASRWTAAGHFCDGVPDPRAASGLGVYAGGQRSSPRLRIHTALSLSNLHLRRA